MSDAKILKRVALPDGYELQVTQDGAYFCLVLVAEAEKQFCAMTFSEMQVVGTDQEPAVLANYGVAFAAVADFFLDAARR